MKWLFHDLHLKIMAFLLAFALYAFVNSETNITKTFSIELLLGVLPTNHILVSELPSVNITLQGTSRAFSMLENEQIIALRMNALGPNDVSYQIQNEEIHLPTGLTITNITPDSFALRIEELVRAELPVQINIGGQAQSGFEIIHRGLEPSVVFVEMPESYHPDDVTVFTEPVDVNGLNVSYSEEVDLVFLRQYVTPLPDQHFEISIDVRQIEIERLIENVSLFVSGPTDRWDLAVLDEKLTLLLRGAERELDRLNVTNLFFEVDLADLDENTLPANLVFRPVLRNLPQTISVVNILPQNVRISITPIPEPEPEPIVNPICPNPTLEPLNPLNSELINLELDPLVEDPAINPMNSEEPTLRQEP